ncbi:hypothetical protein IKG05_02040 [Candidatus Saccharibacteria bacterium]|nr:hypothetical protein [Candidatus Saccharibacteria bacterium]
MDIVKLVLIMVSILLVVISVLFIVILRKLTKCRTELVEARGRGHCLADMVIQCHKFRFINDPDLLQEAEEYEEYFKAP